MARKKEFPYHPFYFCDVPIGARFAKSKVEDDSEIYKKTELHNDRGMPGFPLWNAYNPSLPKDEKNRVHFSERDIVLVDLATARCILVEKGKKIEDEATPVPLSKLKIGDYFKVFNSEKSKAAGVGYYMKLERVYPEHGLSFNAVNVLNGMPVSFNEDGLVIPVSKPKF